MVAVWDCTEIIPLYKPFCCRKLHVPRTQLLYWMVWMGKTRNGVTVKDCDVHCGLASRQWELKRRMEKGEGDENREESRRR